MQVVQHRVAGQLRTHLLGDAPHLQGVGPDHAELYRVPGRRAEFQPRDAHARRRKIRVGREAVHQPLAQALARLDPARHHDELRVAGVGKLRRQRQVEAWRAGPCVRGVVLDVRILGQDLLQLARFGLRGVERGTFLHPQLDHQLRPRGGREELLLDQRHSGARKQQCAEGHPDDRVAALHGPGDRPPQALIRRRLVRIGHTASRAAIRARPVGVSRVSVLRRMLRLEPLDIAGRQQLQS